MATALPQSARRHHAQSAALARRALVEARKARRSGFAAVARAIIVHQAAQAALAERAVAAMLAEQEIEAAAEARLNSLGFTTGAQALAGMLEAAGDQGFDQLTESLVQDAGRAAESVSTAVRPNVSHTRFLSPPSCSRCAVLAGRIYRYSEGFQRHPRCDCTMIPTTASSPYAQDPVELLRQGKVTGISKADQQAIRDGADLNQVVNVRRKAAGLQESGRVLARSGRPTPEGIYRMSNSRTEAVDLLARFGYVH